MLGRWARLKPTTRRVVVGAMILMVALGAAATGQVPLQAKIDELEGQLAGERQDREASETELRDEVDAFAAEISSLESQLEDATAKATDAFDLALEEVRADFKDRQSALDERASALESRERELERRERAVGLRENFIENNSFGDGLYKVGTDIQAGTYHTSGGGNCYWAKLGSSNTSNILDNRFGAGPQTVEITSPWFESQGCGTWMPA